MKQQAISKIFTTAKHSQSHRVADFQIDQISELNDKVKMSQLDTATNNPTKVHVVIKEKPESLRTASSTKPKKSKVKVGSKRPIAVSIHFSEDANQPEPVGDLPVNRELSKKRKLGGKSAKLSLI